MGLIKPGHRYSFSQLSQFNECPFSFYLLRIEEDDLGMTRQQTGEEEDNAFSQYGTLMHSILERWAKKELDIEELPYVWEEEYDRNITKPWPRFLSAKGYAEKAYKEGYDYLKNFDGFYGFTVLAAEQKFTTTIAGKPFVGVIDLLLENNETGEMYIVDHKSKSKSAFKKSAEDMYKQIILYSKFVYEKYGRFPDVMMFNLFKEQIYDERKFDKRLYAETLKWAEDTINKMETFDIIDWLEAKDPDFFCQNICSVRAFCDNGKKK